MRTVLVGSNCGIRTYEESSWVREGLAVRGQHARPETGNTERFETGGEESFRFYRGWDRDGTPWTSNVAYIAGGLIDSDVMGFVLQELSENFGGFVAWGATIHRFKQGEVHRADWGHPIYIQFRGKEGANQARQEYSSIKDRPDEGGKRTLRLEYSLVEFCMDEGE